MRLLSLRLSLLLPALLLAACPGPGDDADAGPKAPDAGEAPSGDSGTPGDDDAGTPVDAGGGEDAGPKTDGGGPDPSPDYPNESCASPEEVTPGQTLSATSAGAADDHTGSCGGAGGADLVYSFTLDEAAGVQLHADGYDMVMYLTQGGCEAQHEVPGACVDDYGTTEDIAIPLLPAGTYHVVIDTWAGAGDDGDAFTLVVEVIPGGFCTNDAIDAYAPNETPEAAYFIGSADLDTRDTDPTTPEPDPFDLVLCEADVDWFLIGHMGGALGLEAGLTDGTGALAAELYAAELTDDGQGSVTISEGAKIADAPVDGAMDRGFYLVKVASTGATGTGDHYYAAVTHACQADPGDVPLAEYDDVDLERAYLILDESAAEPIERRLCGDDVDTVLVRVGALADVTITLGGGAALDHTLEQVVVEGGNRTLQAYPGAGTATSGDDLVFTLSGVPAGTELLLTTRAGGPVAGEVVYTVGATFDLYPPPNDACAAAAPLDVTPGNDGVLGFTTGGTHDIGAACNYEMTGGEGAPDVFYTFSLAQPQDTEIRFDGDPFQSGDAFWGAVYLFQYPGTCPADFSALQPVTVEDPFTNMPAPLCRAGGDFRIRLPGLEAGEYLLVVDGDVFFDPVGNFRLTVQSHPGGFPPPRACIEATSQALPQPGMSVMFQVDTTVGANDVEGEDYSCFGYSADGKERVILLEPTQDLTVDIQTSPEFDTMIALREGSCGSGPELACDDESPEGLSSLLEGVALTAGTPYYLFIDGYAGAEGTTTVTITAQ